MSFGTTYTPPVEERIVMDVEMSMEEYKDYIYQLTNRILKGNYISMNVSAGPNNEPVIKFSFREPEWYTELDDDTKYNVRLNLGTHLETTSKQVLQEMGNKVKSTEIHTE